MKLRQKLAVVLASAMVVTAVPVVTMAGSTNGLKSNSMSIAKDSEWFFNEAITTAQGVQIIFTGHVSGDEVFYLDIEGSEFKEDTFKNVSRDTMNKAVFEMNVDLYVAADLAEEKEEDSRSALADYNVTGMGVYFERQGSKTVKVVVSDALAQASKMKNRPVTIPLVIKAGDGESKVTIDPASSTVSNGDWVFANATDKALTYSVGEKTTFYTDAGSKLSELTLKENYKDSLKAVSDDSKRIITLELEDSDFNFYNFNTVSKKDVAQIKVRANKLASTDYELKRGFSSASGIDIYAAVDAKDEGKLYIYIERPTTTSDSAGEIVLKKLLVDSIVKDPSEGDFLVDIKGDCLKSEGNDVVMGEVVSFKNLIKMKDDKPYDVAAGRIKEIEFEVSEAVENTMITDRTFEINLGDNAHFDYKGLVKDFAGSDYAPASGTSAASFKTKCFVNNGTDNLEALKINDLTDDGKTNEDDWKKAATLIDKKWLASKVLDNYSVKDDGTEENKDWKGMQVEFDTDEDGLALTNVLVVKVGTPKKDGASDNYTKSAQNNDNKDSVKFKVKVCVPVDKKDEEKVVVTASGRALENETFETTAINIINPFKVEYTDTTLKVGLKDQESTATFTITETDKEMFLEDGTLYIGVKGLDKETSDGIRISSAALEASGEIKRVKTKTEDECVKFTFKRDSNAAATVKVSDIKFDVDRTVPEGNYDIEIWGSAICQESKDYKGAAEKAHKITLKDAIKIGTPNTEDITSGGLAKGTTTFVIGESKYISNGIEVAMDAPSYIQDPGYTMVPVRYVAQAFGVDSKNILFGNGTVTIFAGERTLSLTNGSNVAVVNGNTVAMGAAVVIKDGRTYAPAGEIARLLGINTSWDSATKTATFTN